MKVCKQMIDFHGSTLISQACRRALQLSESVTVVTGAYHHRIEAEINKHKVNIIYNENWQQGIASSLSMAVKREFNSDRLLVMYCHQPFIPASHYTNLKLRSDQEPKKIIATDVNGQFRIPAIFPHHLFYELTTLKGEESPDQIIDQHLTELASIPCEQAAFSVNSPEDMAKLRT